MAKALTKAKSTTNRKSDSYKVASQYNYKIVSN